MSDAGSGQEKVQSDGQLIILIATMMSLNAFAIDMMLPALGQIGRELGAFSDNARQLIVVIYLVANGIGQLFVGPLVDRFGRRSVLLWALAGYSAGCVLSLLASTFFLLLAARVFQGVATAAARVAAVAILRDQAAGPRMAEVMSFAITIFMAAPIIAPGLGQLVLFIAPWQGIFVALLAYGAILGVWIYLRQPETLKPEAARRLDVLHIGRAYGAFLTNPVSVGYTLASALCFASVFAYVSSSEQIFLETFELGAYFPLVFASTAGSLAAASMLNARWVKRIGVRRITHSAILSLCLFNSLHLLLSQGGGEQLALFVGFMLASFFCMGMIGANATSLALEPMGHIAGLAAGVNGFVGTALAGLIGGIVGFQYDGTTSPIVLGFWCLSLVALFLVLIAERGRLFGRG